MDCPRCGRPSPDDARFCSQCGAPLIPDASNAANPLEEPASTEEFKPVTILFVDIVASTELVSNLDAEQAMGRLAPALAVMRRVAEQFLRWTRNGELVRSESGGYEARASLEVRA